MTKRVRNLNNTSFYEAFVYIPESQSQEDENKWKNNTRLN